MENCNAAAVFRPVRRKGEYLKTCLTCYDRKPAYVVTDDLCTACRARISARLNSPARETSF